MSTDNDPDKAALRPRARIMKTLGDELISNDAVAVIELVKNAYDANAHRVLIKFEAPLVPGSGSVEILDDGCGMSLETVRSAWMEPATPFKRKTKRVGEPSTARRVLGEKGIGRFATLRLASELELITRAVDSDSEVYAIFDWTQFDDEEKYLDEVVILTEKRSPRTIKSGLGLDKEWVNEEGSSPDVSTSTTHGTLLRMNGLKQVWDDARFKQIQRGLARLVSPFLEKADFRIRMAVPEEFSEYSAEIGPPALVQHPHYTISGTVSENGQCTFELRVEATGETRKIEGGFIRNQKNNLQLLEGDSYVAAVSANAKPTVGDALYPMCGPISIDLRVWDRNDLGNVLQLTNSTLKNVREDLDAIAGINIYRDGFRVLPYGEPNNDWLRLDIRRVQKPTVHLSNNQVVGYISITADQNPNLKDQSNREGLDENQGYADLKEIMISALTEIENLRKRSKEPSVTRPLEGGGTLNLFSPPDFSQIRAHLNATSPADSIAYGLLDDVERVFTRQLEGLKSTVAKYHALATLGQLIDVLLHDGRAPLSKIAKEATLGREDITEGILQEQSLLEKLRTRFDAIQNQSDVLSSVFRRVEPFGGRKRGRPRQLYLEKIIEDSFNVFSSQLEDMKVSVSIPDSKTLVRVDEAEIQEVIVNLLQNSLYWLQFVGDTARRIAVSVKRTAQDHIELVFADTGPGVPKENRGLIFQPYFSTKKDGVGLGLAIAGEIVSDYYGGKLELMDNVKSGGAVFRITLTKRV
jgi:signal transduction histidine kinase